MNFNVARRRCALWGIAAFFTAKLLILRDIRNSAASAAAHYFAGLLSKLLRSKLATTAR